MPDSDSAPRSSVEEWMVGTWKELLSMERVGIHDDFFQLGGHSLLATRMMSRVRAAFGVEVPLRVLFERPTIAALAGHIAGTAADNDAPPLIPARRASQVPMSFAQMRLWFLDRLQPGLSLYNVTVARRLLGTLDRHALEHAFKEIVQRHETLRTTFRMVEGEPLQVISAVQNLEIPSVDLSGLDHEEREQTISRLVCEESERPFDLEQGPLLRVKLFRAASEDHVLVVVMHHIVSDGWSLGVLFRDLSRLYTSALQGESLSLPPLPVQYADYSVWQREWLRDSVVDRHLEYWRNRLSGLSNLELPTDRPRPAVRAFRGARTELELPLTLSDRLLRFSRQEGATLFMVLLAGLQTLLHRYSGQTDIAVGSPIAGRNRTEIEGLIGFFVNTLVLRIDLSNDPTVRELLARVREVALGAYTHQDLPFEKLVEVLHPERNMNQSPMFQVMFALQDSYEADMELPGLRVSPVTFKADTAKFDLTLFAHRRGRLLSLSMEYDRDIFRAETVQRMLNHLHMLLEGMTTDPVQRISQLPLLTPEERTTLLNEWNDTSTEYPRGKCVHELFEEQAARTPERIALVHKDRRITYAELNRRANRLADHLRGLGIGPDIPVGIYLDRCPEMVVSILGVLKAGGAYLPLDPAYPAERIRFMLEDADAPVVITSEALVDHLPQSRSHRVCLERARPDIEGMSEENPPANARPDQLANIIYTSGSTGLPKGVEVLHRGVVRLVMETDYVRFDPEEVFLQLAPISFDASTFELWGALLHGGTCVLFPERVPSPPMLEEVIRKEGVSTLWLTSSLFNAVIDEAPGVLRGVRQLLTGGEALSVSHVRRALELLPETRLINGYGPTESTTFASCYEIPRSLPAELSSVPIGRPIANTRIYLLDSRMQPVPVGVSGELFIGGDGLARGYLNREPLTAERFVADPFSGDPSSRLYRTGDLARYLPDGNIEFLGRIDEQLKIRGFRIEPGEIESQITGFPGVRQAAVIAHESGPGERKLVAYVVADDPGAGATALRSHLGERLPGYMIPAAFAFLDALPLTPNGKLDRSRLPVLDQVSSMPDSDSAPRSSVEEWMVGTWKELLSMERVGIHDDFFVLGGHSLLAVKLMARIRERYQQDLPLAILFQARTIAQISKIVHERFPLAPWSPLVPVQPEGSKPPLFIVHAVGGNALSCEALSRYLGKDYPVYGLQAYGVIEGQEPLTCLKTMASNYMEAVRGVQPHGPYYLGGISFGGIVAYEMAVQLHAIGEKVAMVFIGDTWVLNGPHFKKWRYRISRFAYPFALSPSKIMELFVRKLSGKRLVHAPKQREHFANELHRRMVEAHRQAMDDYMPEEYPGRVVLFRGTDFDLHKCRLEHYFGGAEMCWRHLAKGGVDLHWLPGDHHTIFYREDAVVFAAHVRECMDRAILEQGV
jgi:aspartate racemase